MSDIPEDVEMAATLALDAILASDSQYANVEIIARAILAERKRCADNVGAYRRMVADSEELEVLEHVIRQGGIEP